MIRETDRRCCEGGAGAEDHGSEPDSGGRSCSNKVVTSHRSGSLMMDQKMARKRIDRNLWGVTRIYPSRSVLEEGRGSSLPLAPFYQCLLLFIRWRLMSICPSQNILEESEAPPLSPLPPSLSAAPFLHISIYYYYTAIYIIFKKKRKTFKQK